MRFIALSLFSVTLTNVLQVSAGACSDFAGEFCYFQATQNLPLKFALPTNQSDEASRMKEIQGPAAKLGSLADKENLDRVASELHGAANLRPVPEADLKRKFSNVRLEILSEFTSDTIESFWSDGRYETFARVPITGHFDIKNSSVCVSYGSVTDRCRSVLVDVRGNLYISDEKGRVDRIILVPFEGE